MKRILVIIWVSGLFSSTGLMAQKAYKDSEGRYILDLMEEAGMPASSVTNIKKTWKGTPSIEVALENNFPTGTINAKVYHKLEIAPYDLNTSGEISSSGPRGVNWLDSFVGCRDAAYDGGGWRLPTQRELIVICIFKSALTDLGASFNLTIAGGQSFYWSATESSDTGAYTLRFSNNLHDASLTPYAKSTAGTPSVIGMFARCVREVTN